jgi:branched-subunit amino acid ABC-type transport system permease component
MQNLGLVLLVFAFVCAVLAAVWSPQAPPRWHLGWAAIAFWLAAEIFGGLGRIFGTH